MIRALDVKRLVFLATTQLLGFEHGPGLLDGSWLCCRSGSLAFGTSCEPALTSNAVQTGSLLFWNLW